MGFNRWPPSSLCATLGLLLIPLWKPGRADQNLRLKRFHLSPAVNTSHPDLRP